MAAYRINVDSSAFTRASLGQIVVCNYVRWASLVVGAITTAPPL
ncbi:MAG: hypothetical protein JWM49_287 [Microbacteriaceae bacterium]|nr:hypothetical protein [Microbacteriaceae bacterium]